MTVQSTITSKTFFPGEAMAPQSLAGLVFLDPDDVQVWTIDAAGMPADLLARDEDYALTGDGSTGTATITPLAPWPVDIQWRVERVTPIEQPEAFPPQQPLSSIAVERGLNRTTLIAQELERELDRAPKVPPGVAGLRLADPAGAAQNAVLAYDVQKDLWRPVGEGDWEAWRDTALQAVQAQEAASVDAVEAEGLAKIALAQAWAEGTEPGGSGTDSAKGWATAAAAQIPLVEAAGAAQVALAASQAANALASANAAAFATLQRAFVTIDGRNAYASVSPAAAWNGTAGTGFASTPTDPTRTTAKPACRLLVPPRQAFTDRLVVGVAAAANNNGRLDNLGLTSVEFIYEGRTVTVTEPSWYSYLDANGQQRSTFGWWAVLLHNGINSANADTGGADLYIRANPADSTMQSRVIGPFRFWPRAALHDLQLTVAPSLAQITGERYQSFQAAMNYISSSGAHFARITATENHPSGQYDLPTITVGAPRGTRGYTVVDATVPIVIGKASYTTDTAALLRPRLDPLWFRGANITFDHRFIGEIYNDQAVLNPSLGLNTVFEGVRHTNSATVESLWRKGPRPVAARFRGNAWVLECAIDNLDTAAQNASLVRNCTVRECVNDLFSNAQCITGTICIDNDSSWFQREINAFTVTYSGAASTATLELSGGNDASSRTFTARENGSVVGTFTVQNSEAAFTAGTNYNVSNVVNWINGLGAGWSATLLDDTRRATAISLAGLKGTGFGATNVKNVTLTPVTMFDLHGDWWQQQTNNIEENIICYNNVAWQGVYQALITSGTAGDGPRLRDAIFINCAWHQKTTDRYNTGYGLAININSQTQRAHSHVVIAHCSFANQGLSFRTDLAYNPDAYCLVANNVARAMSWSATPDADLRIADNHLETGATNPSGGVNTTIGGTVASMFVNAAAGGFQPIGELLTNQKPAKLRLAARGPVRQALAPAGALG